MHGSAVIDAGRLSQVRINQRLITNSNDGDNDNTNTESPPYSHYVELYSNNFHPIDDPSCQDNTWYDAISPYWTGGMVWKGAYVLNHQVVSVTTEPIFVSNLSSALELSGVLQFNSFHAIRIFGGTRLYFH
jgi:hypothetical protein